MSELGQMLKKARLEQNISLDELQETTKIRKRYLEAIENGEFQVLPGSFYVRAFIKSYSEAVGLNPEDVLRFYKNVIPQANPEQHIVEPIRRRKERSGGERIGKWASTTLMVSFLLLICSMIYIYVYRNTDLVKNNENDPSNAISEQNQANSKPIVRNDADKENDPLASIEPIPEVETVQPVLTLMKTEKNIDYYSLTQSDSLKVEMKAFGGKCWFEAKEGSSGGKIIDTGTLNKDDTRVWEYTDSKSVYIKVGAAGYVDITVQGHKINMGDVVGVKRIQIDFTKS